MGFSLSSLGDSIKHYGGAVLDPGGIVTGDRTLGFLDPAGLGDNGGLFHNGAAANAVQGNAVAAQKLRDQFAAANGAFTPTVAPQMSPTQLNTTQSDQARGWQAGGLAATKAGLATQGAGLGVQNAGLGLQGEGAGVQRDALGTQQTALGTIGQGVGAQLGGLGDQKAAAQSYKDVLSGGQPSVAELSAQKLAGQNIAAAYGGAAGASGANRSLALRTAINGAGALGAQSAANGGIQRAAEMDAARGGLLSAGNAQAGTGSSIVGAGSTQGGIGNNQSGIGSSITGAGQGISSTGAGIANTGLGMVNTGVAQTGIGTSIRNGDITTAGQQANLTNDAGQNNLSADLTTAGQNITARQNAANNVINSTQVATNATQPAATAEQAGKDSKLGMIKDVGSLIGISDERVKTNVQNAQPSQISQLFKTFTGQSVDDNAPPAVPSMTSDKNVKANTSDGAAQARDMFAALVPKAFTYKGSKLAAAGIENPPTDGSRHLGVLAQDVEKSGPLGKGMVEEENGVKGINLPMAVSALMAWASSIQRKQGHARG